MATIENIRDAWVRYAHRSDLTADLALVEEMAWSRIRNRLFELPDDLDTLLTDSPQTVLHAGLMSIHELAQDDDGLGREATLFEAAIGDYAQRLSLTTRPQALATYNAGG